MEFKRTLFMSDPTATPDARPPVLELRGITKRFPGILANDHVDLALHRGEILALLGENGAGKSTLMNVLYGLYHADEGEILLNGEPAKFASPREAIRAGIGMVHQHFQLIPVMSVAENITLGEEKEYPDHLPGTTPAQDRMSGAVRRGWGSLWRILTPLLAVAGGLLIGQIFLQMMYIISTYMADGPQFATFQFERLPLAQKGLAALGDVYQRQPTLATAMLFLPLVLACIAGATFMVLLYRHARHTWRGSDPHARAPADTIIEAVIDFGATISATLNQRAASARVRTLSQQFGLEVDPLALVETLPVGAQQRVEIVKALYRKADILILDEPTAVLTPQEGQELFRIMRDLAARGVSIIFITHKLREVLQVADQIVVMRGGKVVGTAIPAESTESTLAALMVGRSVLLRVAKDAATPGEVILRVDQLSADDDRKAHALQGVSFEVRAGEVLGIAGVQGNGQTELVEALTGLRKTTGGSFEIAGQVFEHVTPRSVTKAGCAHIPEDRQRYGMVSAYSVADNLVLNTCEDAPFAAPPTPARLPVAIAIFGVVFLAVFIGLSAFWTLALYPIFASVFALDNPEITARESPLRFIFAALVVLAIGVLFGVIAAVVANFVTRRLRFGASAEGGVSINREAVESNATQRVREFDIRTPSIRVNAGNLSGGNQQKMVVAREFSRKPRLLIASQPTRGIEVGSIEFIHQQIIKQRDEGAAVLLVSAELDEILALSDRIAVMFHGQIIETLTAATREQLGLLMAGVKEEA